MDDSLPREKKFSWWERRTRIEKCLLVLSGFCVVLIIYLASNLLMRFPTRETLKQDVCMTEKCIRSAASLLKNMDRSVNPCEDFYKFTCGRFIKETIIPDDQTTESSFSDTNDKVQLQLMNVYEEKVRDNDPYSLKLLKNIYQSCMNTTRIEKESLNFVKKEFKDLGGWPVIETYWNEKVFDWKNLMFRFKRIGWRKTFFYSIYIDSDKKNSTKPILTITQPCFPYERFKKGFNDSGVEASYDFLVEIAVLFGADRATAMSDMKAVVDFKIEIAKIIVPHVDLKNRSLSYNPMTIRDFQRNFTNFPWLKLINNYLSPIDMLTSDDIINVAVPKYFESLENFLPKVKKRILANYMFSRIVLDSITYLPESFRKKQLEFFKTVYGVKASSPRWKDCVWEASGLNVAASSVYVKRFFDKSIKHKVSELVIDVKTSFLETLRKIGWMDRKTKKHALLKAEKMNAFIGYPDEVLDDNKVNEVYSGLEIDPDEQFLKVVFNLSQFSHMKHVQELRKPVQKNDWRGQAYTFLVNAFYVNSDNTIELPAAVMQDHFFDPERPQYMNYGAIGEIIGHEITHGFDDRGRQYDKDGNLVDWWEPETNRTFTRKSQCLVEQYGNFTIPEIEMSLNGVKSLGENIADNGGIKIAYRGYLKWLERNKAEPSLPGLPYTSRQLFWISSAANWCTKYKKEYLKEVVTSGHHSPAYFRVIVPFMNSDYFGRDFNCPLGSPMNPKYKCRVW